MLIELLRPLALLLIFVPLLVINLRNGLVPNGLLLLLFATGVVHAFALPYMQSEPLELGRLIWWGIGIAGGVAIFVFRLVPGGTAKLLMALLPWFALSEYLIVMTIGMFLAAAIGLATKRDALIVPPMMVAALGVSLAALATS